MHLLLPRLLFFLGGPYTSFGALSISVSCTTLGFKALVIVINHIYFAFSWNTLTNSLFSSAQDFLSIIGTSACSLDTTTLSDSYRIPKHAALVQFPGSKLCLDTYSRSSFLGKFAFLAFLNLIQLFWAAHSAHTIAQTSARDCPGKLIHVSTRCISLAARYSSTKDYPRL